jgi:hypothetical protein
VCVVCVYLCCGRLGLLIYMGQRWFYPLSLPFFAL